MTVSYRRMSFSLSSIFSEVNKQLVKIVELKMIASIVNVT